METQTGMQPRPLNAQQRPLLFKPHDLRHEPRLSTITIDA
jgi:hypothetical protein